MGSLAVKQGHGDVWNLASDISEYIDLLLSWSVLMSIASDNTYGQEERAVED